MFYSCHLQVEKESGLYSALTCYFILYDMFEMSLENSNIFYEISRDFKLNTFYGIQISDFRSGASPLSRFEYIIS